MTGRLIMVSDKREMKQLLYTLLAAVFCVAACHSVESSEALVAEDDVLYACIVLVSLALPRVATTTSSFLSASLSVTV